MGYPSPYADHPELGRVKRCPKCGEWWPADGEFYFPRRSRCKACVYEDNNAAHARRRSERQVAA